MGNGKHFQKVKFIMPRRHKSKRHPHGKNNKAQSLTKVFEPAGPAALPAAEEPSPSSQGPLPAVPASCPRETHTAPCPSTPSLEASDTSSEEEFSDWEEVEEKECPSDAISPSDSSPPSKMVAAKMMGTILISNFHDEKLTTEEELLQVLTEEDRDAFPEIFEKACARVEDDFEVEVREVRSAPHSYDLRSKLKLPNKGRVHPGKGYPKTKILMDVLAFIFKFHGRVCEMGMWDLLMPFHVYPGRRHRVYGEPRKLLTEDFVRLRYLEYQQLPGRDPPCYAFLWGPQAHTESCRYKIMEREHKRTNLDFPFFMSLYEKILEDEELRGTTAGAAKPGTSAQTTGDPRAT
ncbi:melanoma-associated antigen B5-like [Ctenodactylus gundi]